ncbi:helix-turn-helix transcriptional regulator [Yinghuangia seranimata]|uniref:helix-turn-helix transcriptional regulator n=1 Tax=Yinghuangia seranimata TaxID=408067 RepID=UPI00248B3508|nr:helix-turn-helix transcriptional regulator [Yinghuangia seranimata]MDI2124925.1 helix-turn-helix transcriptional regulator [Yinghuangia seranimata]
MSHRRAETPVPVPDLAEVRAPDPAARPATAGAADGAAEASAGTPPATKAAAGAPAADSPHSRQLVRRGELSAFLRSRRERIRPADVGLPQGSRRRTPGLRREEVAQLAGVGVTWYTWLEQGRPIKASAQVLDAVARTLRLDVGEREHLYRLADIPSVTLPDAGDHVRPEVQQILDHLDPLPAAVYNARYDTLAWNSTYAAIFPGVALARRTERNVLWNVFTVDRCCCVFVDPASEHARMVASLRAAYGRHVGEPAWTAFVQRLCEASTAFATLWARQDVLLNDSHTKRVKHPEVGVLTLTSTAMALDVPETRMVVYTPTGDDTRAAITRLRGIAYPRVGCPKHGYLRYGNPAVFGGHAAYRVSDHPDDPAFGLVDAAR